MRLHRLTPALLGVLVPLTLAPAVAAAPPTAPVAAHDPAAPPLESTPAAAEALEQATEALTGLASGVVGQAHEHADATLSLLELRDKLPELDRADRREARALLARPSSPTALDGEAGGAWTAAETAQAEVDCSAAAYCLHWVPTTLVASGGNRATPDEVARTKAVLDQVWATEIGSMGYRPPVADLGPAKGEGPDTKLDVYLANTGSKGLFGYAVPERTSTASSGYIVLDNDFEEFTRSRDAEVLHKFRKVTAAHEFFHVVQFAYDSYESSWLMESTATWVEERVYDEVDDNRYYLSASSLRWPGQPLNTVNAQGAQYGAWVFHELVTQRLGVATMRSIWDHAARTRGDNARQAISSATARGGSSLLNEFRTFTGAAMAPRHFWSEGAAYPSASIARRWTLSRAAKSTGLQSARIDHLASAHYVFQPKSTLTRAWKLRLRINAPASMSTAYVTVFFRNGSVKRIPLGLDSSGDRTYSVPFSARTVSRVQLALGNAGTADNRLTTFKATIWR